MRGRIEPGGTGLAGARILAVEDDFVILLEIASVLSDAGAVVKQCTTIGQTLQAIDAGTFDAAILDVRIGRETIAPVAHKLTEAGTPFLFYTGQVARDATMSQWPEVPLVAKPAPPAVLVGAVAGLLEASQTRAHGR